MSELLIRKAKKGDSDAFCKLMNQHMESMYKISRAYLRHVEDGADAIQETILSCFEHLPSLRQNRYFKTWMTRILINHCKDILHQRSRLHLLEQLPETPVYEENYETLEWEQLLSGFDEETKSIFLLYYLEEFRIRDIADILGLKESTIKSRLQRGRKKLLNSYTLKEEHV